MLYEIKENRTYNSNEVYFNEIPPYEVREELKKLKMRWNRKKACWYGFASESELINAIQGGDDKGTVVTAGYLGGGAVYGSKSNQSLYGAELSRAVRQDLKINGIKGVTVSCKTYSGGQSLTAKVKVTDADMRNRQEYVDEYKISPATSWIWTGSEDVSASSYYNMDGAKQEEIRIKAANAAYEKALNGQYINEHYINKYNEYTDRFIEKLEAIKAIITAYRYDESNAMVDYFNTNFYYTIETKGVEA